MIVSATRTPGYIVLLVNARSAKNKTTLIRDLILNEGADLACIAETWVGEEGGVPVSQLCSLGYLVQHQGSPEGQRGGMAIVYKDSFHFSRLPVPLGNGLEGLCCVLGLRDRLGILLVYCPPCCLPTVSLSELTEMISDLVLRTLRLLVLGDLNLHAKATLTGAAQDFMATMTTNISSA